jgi:hypothetical protein
MSTKESSTSAVATTPRCVGGCGKWPSDSGAEGYRFDSCRGYWPRSRRWPGLFVAPTRFASGEPCQFARAASFRDSRLKYTPVLRRIRVASRAREYVACETRSQPNAAGLAELSVYMIYVLAARMSAQAIVRCWFGARSMPGAFSRLPTEWRATLCRRLASTSTMRSHP